jgi:hypothetical protein
MEAVERFGPSELCVMRDGVLAGWEIEGSWTAERRG